MKMSYVNGFTSTANDKRDQAGLIRLSFIFASNFQKFKLNCIYSITGRNGYQKSANDFISI